MACEHHTQNTRTSKQGVQPTPTGSLGPIRTNDLFCLYIISSTYASSREKDTATFPSTEVTLSQITNKESSRSQVLSKFKLKEGAWRGLAAVPRDKWQVVDGAAKLTPTLPLARWLTLHLLHTAAVLVGLTRTAAGATLLTAVPLAGLPLGPARFCPRPPTPLP